LRFIFTIITSAIIITAVLWPGSSVPETDLPGVDKVVHFGLFAAWTIAIIFEFDIKKWYVAIIAGLLFALFSELIQIPTDARTFDLNDLIADGAGVVFGYANAGFVIRISKKFLGRKT
jgi:VanZ family protein